MRHIVPPVNRELFAQNFNSGRKQLGLEKSTEQGLDVFLAVLHSYLFLCREVNLDKDKYELIRKSLQEISDFFTIGDVESFQYEEPQYTTKTFIKLG